MALRARIRLDWFSRPVWCAGTVMFAVAVIAAGSVFDTRTAVAQRILAFPKRERPAPQPNKGLLSPGAKTTKEQMLVRANEINYDYTNERVAAVGNVQIYYNGSGLEADKVIFDQKTKRLHAEGNVRLSEPDGKVIHGEIIDLSDDFRDGFVDSLRIEGPDQTRIAANRLERTAGNLSVFQSGVYTACEPCKDDPTKPPKWQVKAARIIHDQNEKMLYFEDARLEFFGVPLAWLPYFSTPDPSEKRKTGFLVPHYSTSTNYGFAVTTPYYWALAPDYDATLTPMVTSTQGPLVQGEWRQRLVNGSYTIRATGIFQLDKQAFLKAGNVPGNRDFRGSFESSGQFNLTSKWVYGWDGTVITDRAFFQDYGLYKPQGSNLLRSTPDYVLSQSYLQGRGERSYFDMRALYFYGFSSVDSQKQIPVIHPVIDHDYTFGRSVFGGELSLRSNLTSLSRETAFFDPINQTASNNGLCAIGNPDPTVKTASNCLLRGVPGTYSRLSSEANWRRTVIDSYGQVFTPFISLRADIANVQISPDAGVANYVNPGTSDVARIMPTAGVEYRYPFISVHSWGTQTIEPIGQLIIRPNETGVGLLPNEDSQSMVFDASNLFRVNKFSGWDRVEGGGRLNAGLQYTAQFNRGGYVSAMFGQSYHLFGQNSFAVGGPTNTGINSGLDTDRSDYVARVAYQPNSSLTLTSRFRFNEADFTLQRTELEATVNFDRWTTSAVYGNYAPQPALGFLERREGVVTSAKFKVDQNWLLLGAMRFDLKAEQISETQLGIGYIDDCFLLALNYITEYAYNSNQRLNHTVMFQFSLRTIGGNSFSTGLAALNQGIPGITK
ncbi:MAG: LPS-assembly protein [Alphaproteobacteria bacterium]|nr:LPS-assembly protein [Alphaproteobacteria bacterium]